MDDARIGRALRALRLRRGWRQRDLGAAAGLSQSAVSLIERGHLDTVSIRVVRRAFATLDARFEGLARWRGGTLDYLLDERHARLVGKFADELRGSGWSVEIEVTYSVYGERGSIDILGWHPSTGMLLVVEIKTEISSVEETIRRLDVKARLAEALALERFDWRSGTVARLLVVARSATNYRRINRHVEVFQLAFPERGWAARRWLRQPNGQISGLLVVSDNNRGGRRRHGSPLDRHQRETKAPGSRSRASSARRD